MHLAGAAEDADYSPECQPRLGGIVILLCLLTIFPPIQVLSTSFKIQIELFTKDIRIIPGLKGLDL